MFEFKIKISKISFFSNFDILFKKERKKIGRNISSKES